MSLGLSTLSVDAITEEDMEMLRYGAESPAGFPQKALLQLARVYGQTIAQIADAEVRLIHIYVHEPMMREGMPGVQMAEAMEGIAGELLPFALPFMRYLHGRFLGHFIEQDVIGHMEAELAGGAEEGRMRVVIAFADLAGYTRLTEERGDEEAVGVVERFVEAVQHSLPIDARVIKTLGDEVMVVGADALALTVWAVHFRAALSPDVPAPRIGIHTGEALYRDGDYYGRDVNQAARVVARAAGGEVLVTRQVVDAASGTRQRLALRADRRNRLEGVHRAGRAVPRVRARGRDRRHGSLRSWPARRRAAGSDRRGRVADGTPRSPRARASRRPARGRAASSRCSPAGATRSACSTSRWRCAVRSTCTRCTSTTGCGPSQTRTSATVASCVSGWGWRSRWCGRSGSRAPPATCTRGRASCATGRAGWQGELEGLPAPDPSPSAAGESALDALAQDALGARAGTR